MDSQQRMLLIVLSIFLLGMTGSAIGWTYRGKDGPANWHLTYKTCKGQNQSPVDIGTTFYNRSLGNISFHNYRTGGIQLKNNGHNIQFLPLGGKAEVSGGTMPNKYKFVGFHLHWGSTYRRGSEHRIKGVYYAAEIHFVHYDATRFKTLDDALEDPTGLGVLAVFVKGGHENKEFKKLNQSLHELPSRGSSSNYYGRFELKNLFPDHPAYYTYRGSLTTPPCRESVIWTIFKYPITFSAYQFDVLRKLSGDHGSLNDNYRPLHKLGSRKVQRNIHAGS